MRNELPKVGVAIGKFLPYHRGHQLLLQEASENCRELWIVITSDSWHPIDAPTRMSWIERDFPEAKFAVINQAELQLPDSDAVGWAHATVQAIGRRPDVAFTSEPEYARWAELMGARHHIVDHERGAVPISATKIREGGAEAYAEFLSPQVLGWLRAHPLR